MNTKTVEDAGANAGAQRRSQLGLIIAAVGSLALGLVLGPLLLISVNAVLTDVTREEIEKSGISPTVIVKPVRIIEVDSCEGPIPMEKLPRPTERDQRVEKDVLGTV